MQNPKKSHLKAAMHVLRYIKGTIDFGIFYEKGLDTSVIGYIDADWGNDMNNRK